MRHLQNPVRRWSPSTSLQLLLAVAISLVSLPCLGQMDEQLSGPVTKHAKVSVRGIVRDSANSAPIAGAKVELHPVAGASIGTVFTTTSGDFAFDGVASGDYDLIVDQPGYNSYSQQIEVDRGAMMALQVELQRVAAPGAAPDGATPVISAHELAAPHKAQDAMQKGLRLLYQAPFDYRGSIVEFERAVKIYPDYYEAYTQMGVAYIDLGDVANAEQVLRKSFALSDEKYINAGFLLAKVLSFNQRFEEAEPLARKAVEVNPQSWPANAELARALFGLNRPEEAEGYAQTAVRLQPSDPILRLLLADIHIHLNNGPAVLEDLAAYLKLVPKGPDADRARQVVDKIQHNIDNPDATSPQDAPDTPDTKQP